MAAGMVIGTTVKMPPMCVVEGWIPVASIPTVASIPNVKKIDLPKYSRPHPPNSRQRSRVIAPSPAIVFGANGSPAIDGNGITIMNVDRYIQQTSVNGTGVSIGVISDDVTSLNVIQGRGELPLSVNVIQPSPNPVVHSSLTDEGTMMLEEVYAVAPGANLAFCGPETAIEYLGCLQNLIAAGATVISDDLAFIGYDVMSTQNNAAAQAVESALTTNANVMLFHDAGNDAQDYWEGAYNPFQGSGNCSPTGLPAQSDTYFQQFSPSDGYIAWQTIGGSNLYLTSALSAGQTIPNNFDVYVVDPASSQVVACSTSGSNGGTVGSTSYTVIDGSAVSQGTYNIYVGTQDASLGGSFLKLIGWSNGADTFLPLTSGAPSSPQDFAAGVIIVGAVYGHDGIGNTIEPFSNTGPVHVESPTPSTLQAPLVVAPDGIFVDTGGTDFVASGGMFYGTSAASPNAAAVAVLLRSAFPTLTPVQITIYIKTGATPLGGSAPNGTFGYGRVDALGALAMIPAPTIAGPQGTTIVGGRSSPAIPFTIGGTGLLRVSASSSTNLIPSSSAGISVSPSTCGNSTTACMLTLTPTAGLSGTTTVQVSVTDGANRTQSAQVPITVTKPAPPTISITSGATQSVTVNAAIAPVAFTVKGTGSLAVTPTTNGIASITLTSGCGTTTMTCTANLGSALSTAGTATLTLTVTDGYAQSTSAAATVTETSAATATSGGGGTLDPWALLGLSGMALLQCHGLRRRRCGSHN
jgi:hypothetical protein